MTLLSQARIFRDSFAQECHPKMTTGGFIKKSLWDMQVSLIAEESTEFLCASDELMRDPNNNHKREHLLKELADLVFVAYQFAACYNLDLDQAMDQVFRSNMSKLDEDGNVLYRADGKVLKGPNYREPDLSGLYPEVK